MKEKWGERKGRKGDGKGPITLSSLGLPKKQSLSAICVCQMV